MPKYRTGFCLQLIKKKKKWEKYGHTFNCVFVLPGLVTLFYRTFDNWLGQNWIRIWVTSIQYCRVDFVESLFQILIWVQYVDPAPDAYRRNSTVPKM